MAPGRSMFSSVSVPAPVSPAEKSFSLCRQQTEIVTMDRLRPALLPSRVRHYLDITPVLLQLPGRNVNELPAAGEPPRDSNKEVTLTPRDTPDGLNIYWTDRTDWKSSGQLENTEGEEGEEEDREREEEEEEEDDSLPGSLILHYPTSSGLTEDSVYSVCAGTLLNSTISRLCSRYIEAQLPLAMEICVLDVSLMDDPSWAQYSLPLLEMMCEAEVSRAQLDWDLNYRGQLVPPTSITAALNCPNNCSSHGDCSGLSCVCYPGYSSYDCSHVDGRSHQISGKHSARNEKIFQTSHSR